MKATMISFTVTMCVCDTESHTDSSIEPEPGCDIQYFRNILSAIS